MMLLAIAQLAAPDVIVVTADRTPRRLAEVPAAISVLDAGEVANTTPLTAAEILNRAAGVHVQAGSGQEGLTSIRSPVLTGGAGAGSFLYLADGVPLRAPGFANVNGLFDAPLPFAGRIEVQRGPGDVAYGSNALHGAVNVITPAPGTGAGRAQLRAGSFDRYGALLEGGTETARGGLSVWSDGGYRADTDVLQLKAYGAADLGGATIRLSAHHLEQETGGFVRGPDAYADPSLRRTNPDPNAHRDVRHVLLSAEVPVEAGAWSATLTPYARWSDMAFRLHFLPGDALEENEHASLGLQAQAERAFGTVRLLTGLDLDATRGSLTEVQEEPDRFGYPQGVHYDYAVDAVEAAPFVRASYAVDEQLTVQAGLRATFTRYDYENELAGDAPVLLGRLQRPPSRTDDYAAVTAKLAATYDLGGNGTAYASLARGARPPQTTDLYRVQRNQNPGGIAPETLDSAEIGWRGAGPRGALSVAGFAMRKDNFFFRDADGFNVTDGKTTHVGVEAEGRLVVTDTVSLVGAATYARHAYAFDRAGTDGRELIRDGDEVDTAPRTLASLRAVWTPRDAWRAEAAWTHVGDYFLDAGNTAEYPGHDILDLRLGWTGEVAGGPLRVLGIVRNATDEPYARRADFAFGSERFFPGEERAFELVVERGL